MKELGDISDINWETYSIEDLVLRLQALETHHPEITGQMGGLDSHNNRLL